MLILVVTLAFLCMVTPVKGVLVFVCVCVCARLYIMVSLPLAVPASAAASGPQTKAVVVSTLYGRAVSPVDPGTRPCVSRVAGL